MEARDGSAGFDFCGTFSEVVDQVAIAYEMEDGRRVRVTFESVAAGVRVTETFNADNEYSIAAQRGGWQSILDHFVRHVEASG